MTKVLQKAGLPTNINILSLKNADTGDVYGVCTEIGKQPEACPTRPRGLEHPPIPLPTCCPRYPPGSTVLECRLEGDQPVAHVVQVPADGNTTAQKMCLLVEAKKSPSGPLSRVISRPQEDFNILDNSVEDCHQSQRPDQLPMSYYLESRERQNGAVALAAKVPVPDSTDCANLIAAFETSKGGRHPDGPTSRVLYGPTAEEEVVKASCCDRNSHNLPLTFIECAATSKGPVARVTQCSNQETNSRANQTKNCFETFVRHDGGCPTATGFQCPQDENPISSPHDVLETRVDECGARAARTFPQDCTKWNYCSYLESKSSDEGPTARITQKLAQKICEPEKGTKRNETPEVIHRSPPDCVSTCACAKKARETDLSPCTDYRSRATRLDRRNGLDPTPSELLRRGSFNQDSKEQRRVCPPRGCEPMRRSTQREINLSKFCEPQITVPAIPISGNCQFPPCEPMRKSTSREIKLSKFCEPQITIPEIPISSKCQFPPRISPQKLSSYATSECKTEKSSEESVKRVKSQKSEAWIDRARSSHQRITNCISDLMSEIGSQELITRYREHISPNQLSRYEACRSKRNGLQDECVLPVPRVVMELKRKEKEERFCVDDNNNQDISDRCKLDQSKISACTDHKLKPHVTGYTDSSTSKKDEESVKEQPQSICV